MNLLDLFILVVLGLFVILGCFKGLWSSLLSLGNYVLACLGAALVYPLLTGIFRSTGLLAEVMKYAEGAERIGNYALSVQPLSAFTAEQTTQLVSASGLPFPMDRLLHQNITSQAFGADASIGSYFNQTIAIVAMNILCFIVAFFLVRLILGLLTGALTFSQIIPISGERPLPLAGAFFGLLRGVILLFVLFMLVPILLSVFSDAVQVLLDGSTFANFFYKSNILFTFIGAT